MQSSLLRRRQPLERLAQGYSWTCSKDSRRALGSLR